MPKRSDFSVIAYLAFLGILLATGIDIALPAFGEIDQELGANSGESLIITSYLVGTAFGTLFWGPIADRFGRRPAILAGLALYTVGAAASALAPAFGVLLGARVIWGLGAAAAAGLRPAITRDLYSGDAMARITTIMMAVFLIGPVFMPLVGELIIRVASWRYVFWLSAALAAIGAIWCQLFGETLAPENRRALSLREFGDALRQVARTRVTLGSLLANVFLAGAFFIYLGSSQPVFNRVFDRASIFAVLFALTGVITIPLLLINNQMIKRHGSSRVALTAAAACVLVSVGGLVWVLVGGGEPDFWLWYVWLCAAAATNTLTSAPVAALALEPMGALAGTVSSLMYFSSFAFGAGLAAIFDAQITTTVTPFVFGYALYMTIGFALLVWSRTGSATVEAATGPRDS